MSTNPKRTVYVGKFHVFMGHCTRVIFGIYRTVFSVLVLLQVG